MRAIGESYYETTQHGRTKNPLPPTAVVLRLSTSWWPRLTQLERAEVLAHEAAHLLAQHFNGLGIGRRIADHGRRWREWTTRVAGRPLRALID